MANECFFFSSKDSKPKTAAGFLLSSLAHLVTVSVFSCRWAALRLGRVGRTLETRLNNLFNSDSKVPFFFSSLPTPTPFYLLFRGESHPQPTQATPQTPYFFYRVLRAAFPLQLFLLLLLLVVCIIPSSEEDYSCTRANNFARSLHLMLQYLNGPPPT